MSDGNSGGLASEPATKTIAIQRPVRQPVVPIAIAFAVGIVFDRLTGASIPMLAALTATAIVAWTFLFRTRSRTASAICFLVICASLGAVHHHLAWYSVPEHDVAQYLPQDRTLIKVQGTVANRPQFRATSSAQRPSWATDSGYTRFLLSCESILDYRGDSSIQVPASGLVRIDVYGEPPSIVAGDRIQLVAKGSGIPVAHNPGEYDFEAYLKNRGIRGLLRVTDRQLIQVIDQSNNPLSKLQSHVRSRCDQFLRENMSSHTLPIAAALLMGDRTMIPNEVRAMFVESGAMHLLAISGLHIGILTAFLFGIARVFGFSDRSSVVIVLVSLFCYLNVADMRPPMVRAFTLVSIWGLGRFLRRPSFSANSLAISAIVVLAMNPSDLFNIGAQLSFLAVASIMWLMRVFQDQDSSSAADIATMNKKEAAAQVLLPRYRLVLRAFWRHLKSAYAVSGTVCLISAPLVAAAFNVVSPIGILINVFLIPIVGIALCCGFLGMVLGAVWQPLGWPLAWVFDVILRLVLWLVELASSIDLGHFYVPSLALWWLLVTYALIGAMMMVIAIRRRTGWGWIGLSGWLLFGMSLSQQPMARGNLKCTFLSVRHGCSILLEMPNGRTLVYDVGCLMNPGRASRVLEHALWKKGHGSIHALVLSHSDADHYNGTHMVLDHFPTKRVLMTRHFLDAEQSGTVSICQRLVATGLPIDVIEKGDRINLDSSVSIRVLHPRSEDSEGNDNSVSVVLEIIYAGRCILLTGDLEEPGMGELLAQEARSVDVLLSPHHGSPGSNTTELAKWSQPRFVVASTGRAPSKYLEEIYGDQCKVFWTSRDGAISFEISPDGTLTHHSFVATE
jgi:competence protein ComEC